ncbi:hypothetical protein [Marivirga sp.]|uniref:hypothetical protein n=1 Tax=Marivirga sp. TaxID=2018662 RepID=UPI003DA798B3
MKKTTLILPFLVTFFLYKSFSQSTSSEITGKFFDLYKKSPEQAIDYAFSTNKWIIDKNQDGIANVKNQLTNTLELIGDYYGFEVITEKQIGENYILNSFLIRYDRQPLRFTFILYKPKDTWQVQSFLFDDNIDDELKESATAYRLKENWE